MIPYITLRRLNKHIKYRTSKKLPFAVVELVEKKVNKCFLTEDISEEDSIITKLIKRRIVTIITSQYVDILYDIVPSLDIVTPLRLIRRAYIFFIRKKHILFIQDPFNVFYVL
jgi:hypothetical protein